MNNFFDTILPIVTPLFQMLALYSKISATYIATAKLPYVLQNTKQNLITKVYIYIQEKS